MFRSHAIKQRSEMDAVTPVAKDLERHQQFLLRIEQSEIGLLFLGDSLTDWWPRVGERSWLRFAKYNPANFGVAGDRTDHLLWRITNGELDGINPRVVVLLIGTNNFGEFPDEQPDWVANGIEKIVQEVRRRLPRSKLLLLGIFPRDAKTSPHRQKVRQTNERIRQFADGGDTHYLDIGDSFLDPNGEIPAELMPDGLHLSLKGYEIWYEKMQPVLHDLMEPAPR
jgi:beta-glucosidase